MPYQTREDPFWTTARYDGVNANGQRIERGEAIFYYPLSRSVYSGDLALAASDEFDRFVRRERTG